MKFLQVQHHYIYRNSNFTVQGRVRYLQNLFQFGNGEESDDIPIIHDPGRTVDMYLKLTWESTGKCSGISDGGRK